MRLLNQNVPLVSRIAIFKKLYTKMGQKRLYFYITITVLILTFITSTVIDVCARRKEAILQNITKRKTKTKDLTDTSDSTTLETIRHTEPTTINKTATTHNPVSTTTQPYLDIHIKEEGTFRSLDNEPYFYVRSAYVDNRFNPSTVQILTVMGWHLFRYSGQIHCHFLRTRSESNSIEKVKVKFHKLNNPVSCFFRSVAILCNTSSTDPPDYVSLSYRGEG